MLDPRVKAAPNIYVCARCVQGRPRGVTLLVINTDWQRSFDLDVPTAGERYTLTSKQLEGTTVELNGNPLHLTSADELPRLLGEPVNAGA